MPLCHWPCSCYPNHSLDQTNDWMNEIYERWVAAHGVVIVTPTHWYQTAERAQADDRPPGLRRRRQPRSDLDARQEARGRRRRSSSRAGTTRSTSPAASTAWWSTATSPASKARAARCRDWLDWMGLIDAGDQARLDRYIGYYEPYATSHDALDRDAGGAGGDAQRRPRRRADDGGAARRRARPRDRASTVAAAEERRRLPAAP